VEIVEFGLKTFLKNRFSKIIFVERYLFMWNVFKFIKFKKDNLTFLIFV